MTKSDEDRGVMLAKVIQLGNDVTMLQRSSKEDQTARAKEHAYVVSMWQFMFGLIPNGPIDKIVPVEGSWCHAVSAGIKSTRRTLYALGGLMLVNMGVQHPEWVMRVLKGIVG